MFEIWTIPLKLTAKELAIGQLQERTICMCVFEIVWNIISLFSAAFGKNNFKTLNHATKVLIVFHLKKGDATSKY